MMNLEKIIDNAYENKIIPKVEKALENLKELRTTLPEEQYNNQKRFILGRLTSYIRNVMRSGIMAYKKAHLKEVERQIRSINRKIKYAATGALASLLSMLYIAPLLQNTLLTAVSFAGFLVSSLLGCYFYVREIPLSEERKYLKNIDYPFINREVRKIFQRISDEYGIILEDSNN